MLKPKTIRKSKLKVKVQLLELKKQFWMNCAKKQSNKWQVYTLVNQIIESILIGTITQKKRDWPTFHRN